MGISKSFMEKVMTTEALVWNNGPLSSFMLDSICTEHVFNMRPIIEISAPLPYNLKTGVEQTIEWLREMGEILKG